MKKTYFKLEESPIQKNKYLILPIHNNLPISGTNGSYALLPARLLNLSYAQYLRFCRDVYGASIIGKKHFYPIAYFDLNDNSKELVELLNKRAEEALYIKEEV